MHFHEPRARSCACIEYVRTLTTSDETLETARAFGKNLGKRIIVSKDRGGFIVNFLLIPYLTKRCACTSRALRRKRTSTSA